MDYNWKQKYYLKEQVCETAFQDEGPFWFLTAEKKDWTVFLNDDDFKVAQNATAVNVARSGVRDYVDVHMDTHAHWMMAGSRLQCESFFEGWKRAIWAWDRQRNGKSSLYDWGVQISEIPNLAALRNIAAYIARNPYVAMRDKTPTGYLYGSADLFFNDNTIFWADGVPFSSLASSKRREICRTRDYSLPESYRVINGCITKKSYIQLPGLEKFFNSGNQFFNMLARHAESDLAIAKSIGEIIRIPDDEMFSIICRMIKDQFGNTCKIRDLSPDQRMAIAKKMHFEYNSTNAQIARMLSIPVSAVDRMFPIPQ